MFDQWFNSILVLDDKQAFKISCQIQPLDNYIQSINSLSVTPNKHK